MKRLDEYYDALPADVKKKGVYSFAMYPPNDDSCLVTQLWKKHMKPPEGQEQRPAKHEGKTWYVPPDGSDPNEIIKAINDFEANAAPLGPGTSIAMHEAAVVQFTKFVRRTKGKWIRVPEKDESWSPQSIVVHNRT